MRSMVFAAELVCSVPNTRWPVSAAVRASRIVSRSRISPTRITSGSSRSAERSASPKPRVCRWTSRWLTRHLLALVDELDRVLDGKDVSTCSDSFLWSIIAASVVDLPEPVGPVTRTTPRPVARDVLEDGRRAAAPRARAPSKEWYGRPRRRRGGG